MPSFNSVTLTVNAGTVQRLMPVGVPEVLATRIIFTPLKAGTGTIDIINFDPALTTPTDNAQTLHTQIGPASASAPATSYIIERGQDGARKISVNEWGIDGSHTGDTVQVSWEVAH